MFVRSWIGAFKKQMRADLLKEIAEHIERGITIIERDKLRGEWSMADDDDMRTLKRAKHIFEVKSR